MVGKHRDDSFFIALNNIVEIRRGLADYSKNVWEIGSTTIQFIDEIVFEPAHLISLWNDRRN